MDLKKDINGITLGIRFVRTFRISDISGDIIDNVLHHKESPFDVERFPLIQEKARREKIIYNEKDGMISEYFRINTDDIILHIKIENNFDKKIEWVKNVAIKYFENNLFKIFKIENIKRLGVIFHHKFEINNQLSGLVGNLTNNKISDPNSINFSFSKKISTSEGICKSGVIDYKNAIYTFEQYEKDLYFDFDYQFYLEPPIQDLRECKYSEMVDDGISHLLSVHDNWLNKYDKK